MQQAMTPEKILLRMREMVYVFQRIEIFLPKSFSLLLTCFFEMYKQRLNRMFPNSW